MLAMEVIEPVRTECASPFVFLVEEDETSRFGVDYHKLHGETLRDSYPIPCMNEGIDAFGDATIFSILDDNNGYFQVEVVNENRDETAFCL